MRTVTVQALQLTAKVMGRNAWRGNPWGNLRKQTYGVRTWRAAADCSKYGQQKQWSLGRPDRQRWTAVNDRYSATVMKQIEGVSGSQNQPCTRAHRRDMTVLFRADTCTREQQTWTESSLVLSASAVGGGAKWYGHTSMKRTRVAWLSSGPTGAPVCNMQLQYMQWDDNNIISAVHIAKLYTMDEVWSADFGVPLLLCPPYHCLSPTSSVSRCILPSPTIMFLLSRFNQYSFFHFLPPIPSHVREFKDIFHHWNASSLNAVLWKILRAESYEISFHNKAHKFES